MTNMVEQDTPYQRTSFVQTEKRVEPKYSWMSEGWFLLFALLFLAELFTPFLRWPLGLPKIIELGIHGATGLILFGAFAVMMTEDRIPKSILIILGITLIWGIVVLYEGQSVLTVIWGWYQIFKYPLIGIFAYLTIGKPKNFAEWFIKFCLALLAFQVGVQIIMYMMGFPINDNMSGTFGSFGTGKYIMMVFFVVAVMAGHWLATRNVRYLIVALVLGLIGSILGAVRIYLVGAALLLGITALLQVIWGRKVRQLLMLILLFAALGAIFLPVYNNFLAGIGSPALQDLLQGEGLERVLFFSNDSVSEGRYDVGRGQRVLNSWQQVQGDVVKVMFGHGLGSRTNATLLGLGGVSIQSDYYGRTPGTSLSNWIQEYGLVGLAVFMLIIIWINALLFRFSRWLADPYQRSLIYGLILFTSSWPVWIFYIDVTVAGIMMILYTVSLGYIFRQAYERPRPRVRPKARPSRG